MTLKKIDIVVRLTMRKKLYTLVNLMDLHFGTIMQIMKGFSMSMIENKILYYKRTSGYTTLTTLNSLLFFGSRTIT
jgi:hypothetical protein